MTSKASKSKDETIEEKYQKMSQHEHVLKLPDTYIGSISPDQADLWIVNVKNKMERKSITFVPGLYKIYDEILINARDHAMREETCKNIKVSFNKKTGEVVVFNDGPGIDVVIHPKHRVYIPEMIFGQLLTSTNYDKKGKTWGGKNGIGAKAANIFSTQFKVETVDAKTHKKYEQTFSKNMYVIGKPIISDCRSESYTKISFIPDYTRFGVDGLTDDMLSLFKKRVYDLACTCAVKKVSVYLDDVQVPVTKFEEYVRMFCTVENIRDKQVVYVNINENWRVAVIYSPGSDEGFRQISFVNGVWTYSQVGGTHVAHVTEQLTKGLMTYIKEHHKGANVQQSYLKSNMIVFVDCVIEDPAFTSQTKEQLITRASEFKPKKCELGVNFIVAVAETGIVADAVAFAEIKDTLTLNKKLNGKKTSKIRVEKHDKALWAGTKKSTYCRLIITEGDSAKTFALTGRAEVDKGQERLGVFPIRGKMLNVREATKKQQERNEEIKSIIQILGLKFGTTYTETNINKLNYGGILILTDQDPDGSHIKGLVINFIHYYWPSLLKINGFLQTMATPLVKAFKNTDKDEKHPMIFYSMADYADWKKKQGVNISKWHTKYYKGLGSSEDDEVREAFADFEKKVLSFTWESDTIDSNKVEQKKLVDADLDDDEPEDDSESNADTKSTKSGEGEQEVEDTASKSCDAIMVAFSKNHVSDRKQLVTNYREEVQLEPVNQQIPFSEFIHKDWVQFAHYDTTRSIPSICDGQKPSQRKILFTMLNEKYTRAKPARVSELSGNITKTANYLHGDKSLQDAIVSMAQNFPGSNNINLLYPAGNFGTRRQGGKDAAASRYIHTYLPELTYKIFRREDEPIYEYAMDDGVYYEPKIYAPIIPMILVNGSTGIGTGFSSNIPMYNPSEIIDNIIRLIDGKEPKSMMPWYKGYNGKITAIDDRKNETTGKYEIINDHTLKITELPIKVWTEDYENFIRSLEIGYIERDKKTGKEKKQPDSKVKLQCLTDYSNTSLPNTVELALTFDGHTLQQLIKKKTIESRLKLTSTKEVSNTNMYLFNTKGVLHKYESVIDILKEFYHFRLAVYVKRKEYHSRILKNEIDIVEYKIKFLKEIIKETFTINKRKKVDIIQELVDKKYPMLSRDINAVMPTKNDDKEVDETETSKTETKVVYKSYKYITDLPLFSLTEEKLAELQEQRDMRNAEYEKYMNTPVKELWREELKELAKVYDVWYKIELDSLKKSSKSKDARKTIKK